MQEAKTTCENRASEAKRETRPIRSRVLAQGQTLYSDTKTKFDGCITYVKAAITRRFNENDPEAIHEELVAASQSMSRFLDWKRNPRASGEGYAASPGEDLIAPAVEIITEWLNGTRESNERAIDQLRSDLEGCRFLRWEDL